MGGEPYKSVQSKEVNILILAIPQTGMFIPCFSVRYDKVFHEYAVRHEPQASEIPAYE